VFGTLCARNPKNRGLCGELLAPERIGATRRDSALSHQDCCTDQPGWDAALLALFDRLPRCGIAGPTLLLPDGRVQSVADISTPRASPIMRRSASPTRPGKPIRTPREVSWITGAALAIRRGLWGVASGSIPPMARLWEDVDLCVRVRMQGWQVWHAPSLRFVHAVGSTGGSPRFRQNMLLFKRRYVDTGVVQPECSHVKVRFWGVEPHPRPPLHPVERGRGAQFFSP